MRLLIVTREYAAAAEGGIARRLSNLVPLLIKRGVEIGVVSFGGQSISGETLYTVEPSSPILYTARGGTSLNAPSILSDIMNLGLAASRVISTRSYDLVQIEEPVFGPFVSSGNCPKIVTVHETQRGVARSMLSLPRSYGQMQRFLFSSTIGTFFDLATLLASDFAVAVSPSVRTELRNYYRFPLRKIAVVPNGVNVPSSLDKEARKRVLSRRSTLIVAVGRLVERKRIDLLLRAIAHLSSTGFSDFSVAIVGRGPERAHLEALAAQLGISSFVEFKGYLEDSKLFDLLEAADICVMPSAYEGGMPPLVVLEAMAYGTVPLVSDIPQLSNSIIDRQNGRTFARDSPDSLAKALTELMTDTLSLRRYSYSARQYSAERSWKSVADGYMDAYKKVLEGTIR